MLGKFTKVLVVAPVFAVMSLTFVANASAAPRHGRGHAPIARGWQGDNGLYKDRYGLGYTDTERHDPRYTNGG